MDIESQYLNLLEDVLYNGDEREDRTGVGTRAKFAPPALKHDLSRGFPLLTTKKTFFKPLLGELLWFIEGTGDERRLAEITYGTRDPERTTIWTKNANAPYWKDRANYEGDLGRVYGVQWRGWQSASVSRHEYAIEHFKPDDKKPSSTTYFNSTVTVSKTDQLKNIINTIRNNPNDRRLVLTAFNVGELSNMALPPCHMFCQFDVDIKNNKLNCLFYMRSADLFLGVPFNIASYALLTHMVAKVTGLQPGELTCQIGNAHIYNNHVEQVKTQLEREPRPLPTIEISRETDDIDSFVITDFKVVGYDPHPAIYAEMAV